MDRIKQTFSEKSKVFIAYLTAGFPSVNNTLKLMNTLVENGVDVIELGYPFSDPTADGPAIQRSSQLALNRGFKRDDYFKILRKFRKGNTTTPVVVFGYLNPVYNMGVNTFATHVKECGGDALLIVDLPFEEQSEIRPVTDSCGLHIIQLVSPATTSARMEQILKSATGFVYQISIRGVTGERESIAHTVIEHTKQIKSRTDLPIALGFGISKASQIETVIDTVDGIVVGSAIINAVSDNMGNYDEILVEKVNELSKAIHHAGQKRN